MKHIADRFTVILDANVLYPFLVRDVLLSYADAGLYRARWTAEIMDEWTSHLIEKKPDKKANVESTAKIMLQHFPDAIVDGYQALIPALKLPDPDDRHVLAAAIKAGAHAIVTENLKDFPDECMAQYEIEVQTADNFLVSTFELYADDAIQAIRKMRARYHQPPISASELIMSLLRKGLVRTAAELKPHIGLL